MLTKNWYRLLGASLVCNDSDNSKTQITMYDGTKATARGDYNYQALGFTPNNYNANLALTPTSYSRGVWFGDGDDVPTLDDYGLAGNKLTNFTATSSVTYEITEDGAEITALYMITNSGDEFTIREVCSASTPYINGGWRVCVIDRTVLDTPVTIPAGGIGQVTYTIRMNYPTA